MLVRPANGARTDLGRVPTGGDDAIIEKPDGPADLAFTQAMGSIHQPRRIRTSNDSHRGG